MKTDIVNQKLEKVLSRIEKIKGAELKDHLTDNNIFLSVRTPRPQHWYSFSVGKHPHCWVIFV